MPGRLPDTGFSCCTVADAVRTALARRPYPENASRVRDDRLATTARFRGPTAPRRGIRRDVESSPVSNTAEHPSSPETPSPWDGDRHDVCAPPVETHRRMRTPRRAALPMNRGATRHRSLVRGPDDAFASFGPKRIAPPGALLERAESFVPSYPGAALSEPRRLFYPWRAPRGAVLIASCLSTGTRVHGLGLSGGVGVAPFLHPLTAASTTTSTTDCFRG
jgi:hypothetical protein